jgi:hypothetical protein
LFNRVFFGTLKTIYIARFTEMTRGELFILAPLFLLTLLAGLSTGAVLDFYAETGSLERGASIAMDLLNSQPVPADEGLGLEFLRTPGALWRFGQLAAAFYVFQVVTHF